MWTVVVVVMVIIIVVVVVVVVVIVVVAVVVIVVVVVIAVLVDLIFCRSRTSKFCAGFAGRAKKTCSVVSCELEKIANFNFSDGSSVFVGRLSKM